MFHTNFEIKLDEFLIIFIWSQHNLKFYKNWIESENFNKFAMKWYYKNAYMDEALSPAYMLEWYRTFLITIID